jgi:hypothetical protein
MTLGDPTRPREDNKTICMKLMRDSKNYHARFRRDKQQQQKDVKIDGSKVVSVRKVSLSMKQVNKIDTYSVEGIHAMYVLIRMRN